MSYGQNFISVVPRRSDAEHSSHREFLSRPIGKKFDDGFTSAEKQYYGLIVDKAVENSEKGLALGVPCDGYLNCKRVRSGVLNRAIQRGVKLTSHLEKEQSVLWLWMKESEAVRVLDELARLRREK